MLITLEELPEIRRKFADKTIVYLGGTFDLVHVGHLKAFEAAKSMGDLLVVSVDSDEATKHYKGQNRPIIPENQRAIMVNALKPVDYTTIDGLGDLRKHEFNEMNVIELLRPDIFATSHIAGWQPHLAAIKRYAGEVREVNYDAPDNLHTTDTIAKIKNQK